MNKEGNLSIDVHEYREKYLKEVEERIMTKKERIPYTSQILHQAIVTEMNRADEETWQIEIPYNKEEALREAEERIVEFLKKNVDVKNLEGVKKKDKIQVDFHRRFDLKEIPTTNGDILIECFKCDKTYSIRRNIFSFGSGAEANEITPMNRKITIAKPEIWGWGLGFVIAVFIAIILALMFGPYNKIPFWITISGLAIWMILKNVINSLLTKELPVWNFMCSDCGRIITLASDGAEAYKVNFK